MSSAKCISIHLFYKHFFTAPFPSEGKPLQPIISFISSPFFHSGLCDSAAFSRVIKRGIPVDGTIPLIFKMTLYFQSFFFFLVLCGSLCICLLPVTACWPGTFTELSTVKLWYFFHSCYPEMCMTNSPDCF